MKRFSTLVLSLLALAGISSSAQDLDVLNTPEAVYANSIEDADGAKAEFKAVLDNANATDAEKTAAMQAYQQKSTPAPGFAYDMTFLMSYTAVTADNVGKYTQAKLAEAWQNDIEGLTFGADRVLAASAKDVPPYMCINSAILSDAVSHNKFAAYQEVNLAKGSYLLSSQAYLYGAPKVVTLNAGDNESAPIIGGSKLAPYSVSFNLAEAQDIKLGFKRNSTAGNLTRIYFNNVELYKVSSVVVIEDDATAGLAAADNADVQLRRQFKAGEYTPICLPFVIENWREVFDDLLLWSNYDSNTETLVFNTVAGANTQARKPYLAKPKTDITADNYLMFKGVNIDGRAAGGWVKSVEEGAEPFPVKMTGNWAEGTVPAGCYYLDGFDWKLSDGSAHLPAFSAYIDASALADKPASMKMNNASGTLTLIETTFAADAPAFVNVYNLQGMAVKTNVAVEEALADLPAGIYIVNGKKFRKN